MLQTLDLLALGIPTGVFQLTLYPLSLFLLLLLPGYKDRGTCPDFFFVFLLQELCQGNMFIFMDLSFIEVVLPQVVAYQVSFTFIVEFVLFRLQRFPQERVPLLL